MTQVVILEKLVRFLHLTNPTNPISIELQNKLCANGHCYGFALCYALMKQQNKLEWWEALLNTIAAWDEKADSLDKVISLPQAIRPSPIIMNTDKNGIIKIKVNPRNELTLRSHMERALNYLFFHQAYSTEDTTELHEFFELKGVWQLKINEPVRVIKDEKESSKNYTLPSYLEMTSEDKKITHTKDKKYVGRYMSDEYLSDFLIKNKKPIQNSICLIKSINHTTTLFFDGKKWHYYDPNYDHTSPTEIHKEYEQDKVADLVKEIKEVVGNTFVFEFVSMDEAIKLDIPKEKSPNEALKEFGLTIIAWHTPEVLPCVLEQAEKTAEGQMLVAEGLLNSTRRGHSGLDFILDYAPACLEKVIDIVFKKPEAIVLFIDALLKVSQGYFKQIKPLFTKVFPMDKHNNQTPAYKEKIRTLIKNIIESGIDVNTPNITGYGSFLHFAAATNDEFLVNYLISKGADTHCKNGDGKMAYEVIPPSYEMADCSKTLKLKMLETAIETLDMKAISEAATLYSFDLKFINITSIFYKSGILRITDAQQITSEEERKTILAIHEVVTALINAGAILDSHDKYGNDILHLAAKTNHIALLKDLIQNPNIPYRQNDANETPLDLATPFGKINTDLISVPSLLSLESAVRNLDIVEIKKHLQSKDIIKKCNLGLICSKLELAKAPKATIIEIVKILIEAGVEINKADRMGETALHWASFWNDAELFYLLATKKADLNLKNKFGQTPYEEGVDYHATNFNPKIRIICQPEKIQILSNKVEEITEDFKADMDYTTESTLRNLKAMFDLFCYDADTVLSKDNNDNTVLHLAVMTNQPDIVANALKQCKEVNVLNQSGRTPIQAGMDKFKDKLNPEIVAMINPSSIAVQTNASIMDKVATKAMSDLYLERGFLTRTVTPDKSNKASDKVSNIAQSMPAA